jgi:hypothetical protein
MILFTLVIFLAMATNIGIVVNDKIRMQNTADLATYAAAYSEAQVLNELVYLNGVIADAVATCRSTLVSSSPYVDCLCQYESPVAEQWIETCKRTIDPLILNFVQAATYSRSVTRPLKAGYATAEENFEGTRGNTNFMEDYEGSPTFDGQYTFDYDTHFRGSGQNIASIANYTQATSIQVNYAHLTFCPGPNCSCCIPYLYYPQDTLNGWFYKDNSDPEIWVEGRVYGTPKKQFLDVAYDGGFFGASATGGDDLIYAYAVAKPYEGSVGPTLTGNPNAMWTIGPLYSPGPGSLMLDKERDLAMVEEYRARLAGLNEDLQGGSAPTDLAREDGDQLGKNWNVAYFKH